MRYEIDGKVVLITGPARGIGAETARLLAARGARLSLVGLEPELLAALAAELGEGHIWFECDVTDQSALERAVAGTAETLGGIDVVIANAGVASHGTVAVGPVEALVRTIDVNLSGVVRTVSATLPHVTEGRGYYLLVSSAAALAPFPGISTYAAAKSGVEQFGNVLRLELAHKGVAVGVAHPSWIDTDMVRDAQNDLAGFREMLGKLPGPFGRVTPLRDCAEAFGVRQLFASRLADYIMGRQMRKTLPQVEAEVRALGRSFGAHSTGLGAKRGAAGGETRES